MRKAAARMYKRSAGAELVTMKRKGKYTSRKKTPTDLVDGDFALLDDEVVVTVYKVRDNSAVCIEANGNRANYSLDRLKKTNQDGRPS